MPQSNPPAIPLPGRIFTPIGAVADGVADDSNAIIAAINKAVAANFGTVYLGSGIYRITRPLATLLTTPISIIGDAANPAVIYVDPSMTGDVLSFSNCWYGSDLIINTVGGTVTDTILGVRWANLTTAKKSGVTLRNFRIIGDRSTSNTQNGIIFYDRNDAVVMENVRVDFIRGIGICLSGIPSNPASNAATVMRESRVSGCRARWCGDWATARPAVMFSCSSKTSAQGGATGGDDANNYNDIELQIIYPEGVGFQSNCHNLNTNNMSNNRVKVIVDSQRGSPTTNPPAGPAYISGGLISSGHTSIASNGVMTITSGGTFTQMSGSGSGDLTVGTYVVNANVPPGTYISAILTGPNADGSGTYQLANNTISLANYPASPLTVASGTMLSCRFTTPMVEIGGGHVGDQWEITTNGSNTLNSNGVCVAFNQNVLNGNTPKTQECLGTFALGKGDTGLLFVVVNSLSAKLKVRATTTPISALSISQSVTVDLGGVIGSADIAIGGPMNNLHVYPGGQKVVYGTDITTLMNANKWPNCEMFLNNSGTMTRWLSIPASPNYTSCTWTSV